MIDRGLRLLRRPGVTTVAALALAALLGHTNVRAATDAAVSACGGFNPRNVVHATFQLDHLREFWGHFPSAPRAAPELESDEPGIVVVFEGPTEVVVLAAPVDVESTFRTVTLPDVVCVFRSPSDYYPNGETLVYYSIPREGFRP